MGPELTGPPHRPDVVDYLRRQAGVIGHGQAIAAGLSGSAIKRRVTTGRWVRLYPRVYLAADHPRTDEVRLRTDLDDIGVARTDNVEGITWGPPPAQRRADAAHRQ